MDDLFLFTNSRAQLRAWRSEIGGWLFQERGLRLKHPNARILSCYGHMDALGHRIRRGAIEVLPGAWKRMQARAVDYNFASSRRHSTGRMQRSIQSSAGLLMFGAEVGPEHQR